MDMYSNGELIAGCIEAYSKEISEWFRLNRYYANVGGFSRFASVKVCLRSFKSTFDGSSLNRASVPTVNLSTTKIPTVIIRTAQVKIGVCWKYDLAVRAALSKVDIVGKRWRLLPVSKEQDLWTTRAWSVNVLYILFIYLWVYIFPNIRYL